MALILLAQPATANRVTIQFDRSMIWSRRPAAAPYTLENPLNQAAARASPKMVSRQRQHPVLRSKFYHEGFGLTTNADFFEFRNNNHVHPRSRFSTMFIAERFRMHQTDNWSAKASCSTRTDPLLQKSSRASRQDPSASCRPTATGASGWSPYIFVNPWGQLADPHGGTTHRMV